MDAIIAALLDTLGSVTGIVRAYDDPPEALNEFPCVIAYAFTGELNVMSAGLGKELHTLVVEVHHTRQLLPQAIDAAKVWPRRVLTALNDDLTLGGTVDAVVWPVRYRAGRLAYAEEVHYGVRFEVTVKVMVAL